jgi:hypothetical protein
VASLRRHNPDVSVVLCLYGGARAETLDAAAQAGVYIQQMGEYADALGDIPAHWRDALLTYPTLHKLLSLRGLVAADWLTRLIYLDCDTYCFGDIAALAGRYRRCDWYAREEPLTLRDDHGYDWSYIDEHALARLARAEGLSYVPPYNTGVMVFSAGLARTLVTLLDDFIWYAWRLLHGACLWRPDLVDDRGLTDFVRARSGTEEQRLALPYPSSSLWIIEEIATWLTLGRVPGLTHDVLRKPDVAQNGEYSGEADGLTVAHYFTSGEEEFFARLGAAR